MHFAFQSLIGIGAAKGKLVLGSWYFAGWLLKIKNNVCHQVVLYCERKVT